ncbi:hypothetical protein [Actinoplanes lobatus]|nr:hypothetical protein [Actinoplanes lobatus]MBB4747868.1 hypothetical protein [Actinoplanes lobatus]
MAPSDEALTWQQRADDWAQQAEIEPYQGGGGQAVEPANRWSSEVTSTGRPTFPADGVGWRTETAEWRATGARWRQTTEWRSSTGSHVWRSTTESWQDEEEQRAAAEREKPSIPGTAWPTPELEAETPSWRRSDPDTSSSWRRSDPDTSSSWRRTDGPAVTSPVEQTWSKSNPSWQQPSAQQPSTQTPSWQQPQQPQTPSWQQPSAAAPSWQQPQQPQQTQQTPSWQQPSTQTPSWKEPQQTPSWQQPSAQLPSRRRETETGAPSWNRSDNPPPGENTTGIPRWERTEAPGWQRSAAEDARHLVREDDRAAWRREADYTERPTRVGRRRAAESGGAPAGGTGWTSGADTDNWAGHTDTGSIPVVSDQALSPDATTWGARSAPPSRRERGRYAEPPPPPPEQPPAQRGQPEPRPGKPRYNANPTNWREDTASWDAEQDTSNWTRDPDTGQWSRAEDDPRVLAWRAEAARRESTKPDEPGGDGGRRPRRAEPVGGVPGGPLPSSSVPGPSETGATWPTSAMPGSRPRSALPGPISPVDDTQAGRRRRAEEQTYPTGSAGRRRAPEPPMAEPIGPAARRAPQEPRREPDDYPPPGGRPGPRPPQWSDPGGQAPRRSAYRDEPYGGGRRELPAGSSGPSYPQPGPGYPQRSEPSYPQQSGPSWSEPSRPEPSRPEQPSWSEPSRPEPSRPDQPSWSDPSWSVQEQPQRGLPPRGSAPQQRPYGTPAGALPAGPSAPEQPTYGGTPRELPPGRSGYGSPAAESTSSGLSWLEQERQRLQEPQGPAYGGAGGPSWLDQERQQRSPSAPTSSGPSWLDQERQQRSASAPTSSGPAWLDQERQQRSPSAPTSSGPAWLEQERQRPAQQGPTYGSARALPAGSDAGSRWTDPAGTGGPRALPTGGGASSWSEQQKPAYGDGDLSGRWPDPLADQSGRGGYGDQGAGGGFGERPPMADWLAAERANRRGADYRGSAGQDGETDWRQELSRQNELAEGESRRYDTSDFPPFRPSGSAAVAGASNLALSATSVISTAPGGDSPTGDDTSWPPRRSTGAFQGTGSYERRPMSGDLLAGRSPDLLDPVDDEEEPEVSSPLAAVGYTVVWYGVPVVLFVLAMFLLNSGQRSTALDTLAGAAPEFGIALVLSMLVAFGLRSATTAWKSPSIGLAAAVVGGGLATVLSSAITGNSLS